MPISKEFLKLFTEFVDDYKRNGTPTFYHWAKEQNHTVISQSFSQLLEIVKFNSEAFHDISIIEHLNATVLLSAKTNPYLLDCWIAFITKYNVATNSFTPIGTNVRIEIGPEGTPSERIIRELKETLAMTQQSFLLAQKAYSTEVESLKRQLEEAKKENIRINSENQILKEQVHSEKILTSLNPQINLAQQQLTSLTELLNTLSQITSHNTDINSFPPAIYSPQIDDLNKNSSSHARVTIEVDQPPNLHLKDKMALSLTNEEEQISPVSASQDSKEAHLKISPPPPPPFESKPTPPIANTKNSRFFSGENFLNELNAKIKEREKKPRNVTNLPTVEKKNL
ncbi:VipA [Legionella norrlandica]|uniref:VipA n=1 Tax=Legionella norrlandica TaxID=1498499 RepID=A0A0A2SPF8_9GAMM|nr:hypothetical protein [Legionella norrlandica]KGP63005.1 VipA [Legionella norrlandica]